MKLSELPVGHKAYTQLGHTVLAVLSRRHDGWCVYVVGAVPGRNRDLEWPLVAEQGGKQKEAVAKAIVQSLFYPSFEVDLPYAI